MDSKSNFRIIICSPKKYIMYILFKLKLIHNITMFVPLPLHWIPNSFTYKTIKYRGRLDRTMLFAFLIEVFFKRHAQYMACMQTIHQSYFLVLRPPLTSSASGPCINLSSQSKCTRSVQWEILKNFFPLICSNYRLIEIDSYETWLPIYILN